MRYSSSIKCPFFSFLIVIIFCLITSFILPLPVAASDNFVKGSSSGWGTVVNSDGPPVENSDSNRPAFVDDGRFPNNSAINTKINRQSPGRSGKAATTGNHVPENWAVGLQAEKQGMKKTVRYSGRAEADGRSATLELNFDGRNVSGRLQAKGVSGKYIRLPSTSVTFAPVPLTGAWESDDTAIYASWKGGDYIDGVLIPDYPTQGKLSIRLAERNGEKVVYLHRIDDSSYGFVFPLQGLVYTPPAAGNSNGSAAGNGYWDPVGKWSGKEFDCPFKVAIAKSGDITVTISCDNEKPEYRQGKWQRQGNLIKFEWSKATMQEYGLEDSTFYAFFDGANCLVVDGGDDDGSKLYRDNKIPDKNNFPKQTIFVSGGGDRDVYGSLGPPGQGYKMPKFSNSIFCGVVKMHWTESRIFSKNPRELNLEYKGGNKYGKVKSIKSYGLESVYVTTGLEYSQAGNSIRVKAKDKGQQQVWISYHIKYTGDDYNTGEMSGEEGDLNFSWLVLVGKAEIAKYEGKKPNPAHLQKVRKPDITKFTISGVVKERGNFQGVEGAIVELIPKSSDMICRTDKNGRFKCTFTNLHSGRKELFVRKPYGNAGVSLEPLDSVEQDLWPIKKYMFKLDAAKDGTSMVITDVIWMQRYRYIDNRYEKELSFKLQK